jgi:hypothetical protein
MSGVRICALKNLSLDNVQNVVRINAYSHGIKEHIILTQSYADQDSKFFDPIQIPEM